MLAMNYRGPYRVLAEQKSAPYIEHPGDAIIRVNRACIRTTAWCPIPASAPPSATSSPA